VPKHFRHQSPAPSGAQDTITIHRNFPSVSSTVNPRCGERHGEEPLWGVAWGGASTITHCHTGNCFAPPEVKLLRHQIHMIFTLVREFILLWNSRRPPVLVTCNPAQLNLLPHKKGMAGGREMPRDLRQQQQHLRPHPSPASCFPLARSEPCAP